MNKEFLYPEFCIRFTKTTHQNTQKESERCNPKSLISRNFQKSSNFKNTYSNLLGQVSHVEKKNIFLDELQLEFGGEVWASGVETFICLELGAFKRSGFA